jgi:hypothetical protein
LPVTRAEVGAVAPVLAGPEEEHLHAGLAALDVQGHDVGLVHGLGIDLAFLGHGGQGADAVAQAGGALELQVLGGGLHLLGHGGHHRAGLAPQEASAWSTRAW